MTDLAPAAAYEDRIPDLFDAWWKESFPFAPANKQTRENFIAFGKHICGDQLRALAGGADGPD